jgi:hypothetical protein
MSTVYEIDTRGFDEQLRKLNAYDQITTRHMRRAMSDSVKIVARVTKGLTRSGHIAAGVDHEILVRPTEGVMGRVVNQAFDAKWFEYGTKAHGVSSDAIAAKIPVDGDTAFLIARSIQVRGTKGKFPMYRAFKASERAIKAFFRQALDRITKDLSV